MASYKARHLDAPKKNLVLPKAAATLAITAGLAVSPLMQTAAMAKGNTCADSCKTGTQETWNACKQAVTDTKAALDKAQAAADAAAAKVEAAQAAEADALKTKDELTALFNEAEAAFEELGGYNAAENLGEKLENAKAAMDKAEADKKDAEQAYTNAQVALREAEIMKRLYDNLLADAQNAVAVADAKAQSAATTYYTLFEQLTAAKAERQVAQGKVDEAQGKVDAAQADLDEAEATLAAAKKTAEDAKVTLSRAQIDTASAKAEHAKAASAEEAALAARDAAKKNLAQAEKDLAAAKQDLAEKTELLKNAQDQYDAADSVTTKVLKAAGDELIAATEAQNEVNAVEGPIQKELSAKITEAEEYISQKDAYKFRMNELEGKLNDATTTAEEKADAVKQLEFVVADEEGKLNDAKQELANAQNEFNTTSAGLAAARATLEKDEALAGQVDTLSAQYDDAAKEADSAILMYTTAMIGGLGPVTAEELAEYKQQAQDAINKRDSLEQMLQDANDAAARLDFDRQDVQWREGLVADAQDAVNGAQSKVDDLQVRYDSAVEGLNTAKQEKAEADEAVQAWSDRYNALFAEISRLDALESQLPDNKEAFDASKAKTDAAQARVDKAGKAVTAAAINRNEQLATAQGYLDDAQMLFDGADSYAKHVTGLKDQASTESKQAEQDYTNAQVKLVEAQIMLNGAFAAEQEASDAYDDALAAVDKAEMNKTMYVGALAWAEQALKEAQEALAPVDEKVSALTEQTNAAAEASQKALAEAFEAGKKLDDAQADADKANAAYDEAVATEASAKKTRDDLVDFYLQAQAEYTKVRSDAAAAIIKAEAVFEHVHGYFMQAVADGVPASDIQFWQPDSSDLVNRVALLGAKLNYYDEVLAGCAILVTKTGDAARTAENELATASDNLADAQDAYDMALACYNTCEEKGYHQAAKKDEKKSDKKDEALPKTGDDTASLVAVVGAAGMVALAGAGALRRRKAE